VEEREREPVPPPAAETAARESPPAYTPLLRGELQRAVRAGGPTDPAAVAQLRRLQRSAGNAAVLRLLGHVAPPALARDPGDEAPATAGALIVDDDGAPAAGQMRRGEFLDQVHERASAVARQEFGLLFMIAGCPWLDHWTDYYRTRSPAEIEAAIRRYAPSAAGAASPAEYLAAVEQRVAEGIASWRDTGELPAPPAEGGEPEAAAPVAPAGVARSIVEETGRPLDTAAAGRLSRAFGRDFSGVRVHAGTAGAGLAGALSSRAVTVGRHVAFAPGEYQPGTPMGDALIAHELAHVIQQEGGGVARTPAGEAYETEADRAAGAALLSTHLDDASLARRVLPALRTGLTLQSCPGGTATAATFEDAVKAGKWGPAATLLAAEKDDAKIFEKLKKLDKADLPKLDAEAVKLGAAGDRVHRPIDFLLYGPAPGTPHNLATVDDAGTLKENVAVGGGTVESHIKVKYTPSAGGSQRDPGFSVGYKGAHADTSHFLQFIWREMVVEGIPGKAPFRFDGPVASSAKHHYRWTTDKDKPNYNTDSADDDNPFYEAGFYNNRSADSTTIFDFPSSFKDVVKTQFDAGATKVTSRAHFTTYLVRDMQVLQMVTTDIEWEFTTVAEPPRTQNQGGGAANALDPEMRKVLVRQYPHYDYIP
jgi:Domain of unknown function (DUF4157)